MKISIFGLGYVGVVSAACLASEGHDIVGVDVSQVKVDMINSGRSPIIEDKIDELVASAVSGKRLIAISEAAAAVDQTDMAIVCVGTPSNPDGALDERYVRQVIEQIGAALRTRKRPFHVVVRSTMVPGTMRRLVLPVLEKSGGKPLGEICEVSFHPEFLRESTSVYDFHNPPKIVIGERIPGSGATLMGLYGAAYTCPRLACSIEEAEMVKYCDNLFHAVKVTFANEIGQFCQKLGVDSRRVMDIFRQDTKLNISPKYLQPGFAFGGSCLPKDLRAFLNTARDLRLPLQMIEGVLPSNRGQIERAVDRVLAHGARHAGLYGLAFKPGTDDVRESPLVQLAEQLLGKGVRLSVYDENVRIARLLGGNKSYIQEKLPHLAELLVETPDALGSPPIILLGHPAPAELVTKWLTAGQKVFDLTGRNDFPARPGYETIV